MMGDYGRAIPSAQAAMLAGLVRELGAETALLGGAEGLRQAAE